MKKFVFQLAFVFLATASFGQTQNPQLYSLYMYSFTSFVQWPPEDSQGDFEITVLGDSPVISEFKKMADVKKTKVGGRTIKVNKIGSMTEYKKSHILYVSTDWPGKYSDVTAKVGDASILVVTDKAAAANKGAINFVYNKEGKLAFELNQAEMAKHKLKASAELTRLAILN